MLFAFADHRQPVTLTVVQTGGENIVLGGAEVVVAIRQVVEAPGMVWLGARTDRGGFKTFRGLDGALEAGNVVFGIDIPITVALPGEAFALAGQRENQADLTGIDRLGDGEVVGDGDIATGLEGHGVRTLGTVVFAFNGHNDRSGLCLGRGLGAGPAGAGGRERCPDLGLAGHLGLACTVQREQHQLRSADGKLVC